jgi:hypothetical protein
MADWLGTDNIASHLREFLSFKEARAFARSLNLRSETEWREYCRSGKRPSSIRSNPDKKYANDGWAGWKNWLGPLEILLLIQDAAGQSITLKDNLGGDPRSGRYRATS